MAYKFVAAVIAAFSLPLLATSASAATRISCSPAGTITPIIAFTVSAGQTHRLASDLTLAPSTGATTVVQGDVAQYTESDDDLFLVTDQFSSTGSAGLVYQLSLKHGDDHDGENRWRGTFKIFATGVTQAVACTSTIV